MSTLHVRSRLGHQLIKGATGCHYQSILWAYFDPPNPWYTMKLRRQTTTPGSTSPTLFEHPVGSLMATELLNISYMTVEELWDGTYGLSSLSKKTRSLTVCLQHFLLNFYKDPECWSDQSLNSRPPTQQAGALPTGLTRQRFTSLARAIKTTSYYFGCVF